MIGRRAGVGLAAALLAVSIPLPAQAAGPVYSVERIGEKIDDSEIVGKKRAGLACLPNGSIHWHDTTVGGIGDRREIVENALEDSGLTVNTRGSGAAPKREMRLRGMITEASFQMCASKWLGDKNALSGDASLTIEWRGQTGDGIAAVHHISTVSRHIDADRAAPLGTISRHLLEDAATDLAKWLQTPHKDEAGGG